MLGGKFLMIVASLLGLSFPRLAGIEWLDTVLEETRNELALLDTLKLFGSQFLLLACFAGAIGCIFLNSLRTFSVLDIHNISASCTFTIFKGTVHLLTMIAEGIHS